MNKKIIDDRCPVISRIVLLKKDESHDNNLQVRYKIKVSYHPDQAPSASPLLTNLFAEELKFFFKQHDYSCTINAEGEDILLKALLNSTTEKNLISNIFMLFYQNWKQQLDTKMQNLNFLLGDDPYIKDFLGFGLNSEIDD